jgi:ATP-dependent RNA helicase DDX21
VAAAVAAPNSVLSEHAFKRLQLGSDDEDEYGSEGEAGPGFERDAEELAVARLGLPDELVATLEKRGITHLFPIQVKSIAPNFWRGALEIDGISS